MEWRCTIPGRPTTKGNHRRIFRGRGGRPISVSSEATIAAENAARAIAWAARPTELLQGPLVLDVAFVFAIPKGKRERVSKRGKVTPAELQPGDACERRVDRGNLLKLLEDALEGVVYENDSQIVGGQVCKVWGERDETRVTVRGQPPARAARSTARAQSNVRGGIRPIRPEPSRTDGPDGTAGGGPGPGRVDGGTDA